MPAATTRHGRRTAARGNAVPMLFAKVMGRQSCDVKADSIVMVVPPIKVDQNVPGTADPFLAGMPAGSKASEIPRDAVCARAILCAPSTYTRGDRESVFGV